MRKRQLTILLLAFFVVIAACTAQESKVQTSHGQVREMAITGEIAKGYNDNGYIIRGKAPAMICTILNPDPKILDDYVKSEKAVHLEVRIVSGDNVEIKTIDGKEYRPATQ